MRESFRAVLAGALMLAAAPAAAGFEKLYLRGDDIMWDKPPPMVVGRVGQTDWIKEAPDEVQRELLIDLITQALLGRTPPPPPTEIIKVPTGPSSMQIGGVAFDLLDPRNRVWMVFFWNADLKGKLRFLSELPKLFLSAGPVAWEGDGAVFGRGPAVGVAQFDDCFAKEGGCEIVMEQVEVEFVPPGDDPKFPIVAPIGVRAPLAVSLSGSGGSALSLAMFVETFGTAQPVPEPQAWAMMIAGFGLVGSALRSRRRRAVCA